MKIKTWSEIKEKRFSKEQIVQIEKEVELELKNITDLIRCQFHPMPLLSIASRDPSFNEQGELEIEKTKCGFYHGSTFHDIPKGTRVVGAYIEMLDENQWYNKNEQSVKNCITFLNSIPKGTHGKSKYIKKYGELSLLKFNYVKKFDKDLISVLLLTTDEGNNNFWER